MEFVGIKNDILGKTFKRYDGWNGDQYCFRINEVQLTENGGIILSGFHKSPWDGKLEEANFEVTIQQVFAMKNTFGGIIFQHREIDGCQYNIIIGIY